MLPEKPLYRFISLEEEALIKNRFKGILKTEGLLGLVTALGEVQAAFNAGLEVWHDHIEETRKGKSL